MKKAIWWMRVVGTFYLLLTLMNFYGLFFSVQMFEDSLPYVGNGQAVSAFTDAWLVFVFELGVLGAMLLYGSFVPEQARLLMLTVIFAEVFRGIVADGIWITRGYDVASYSIFIVIHLVIIATGILFLPEIKKYS